MSTRTHRKLLLFLLLLTAGCALLRGREAPATTDPPVAEPGSDPAAAAGGEAPVAPPRLTGVEIHSLRLPATLGATGEVELGAHPPLAGRLLLAPILQEEGFEPTASAGRPVQLVVHYGRFYVALDGFHAVWELEPLPGSENATYRPIRIVDAGKADGFQAVRLSRFGRPGSTCVRVDHDSGPTVFIDRQGRYLEQCE